MIRSRSTYGIMGIAALLMLSAARHAQAQDFQNDYRARPGEAFTVERSSPDAVIHFAGIALKDARTDPAKNEIVLTFDGQADRAVFDRLETALPGWVDNAYSGYDSAVIRAARPVTFMTRKTQGGFDLRMAPQKQAANSPQLRGQLGAGGGDVALDGMQPSPQRAAFTLRGADLGHHRHGAPVELMAKLQPIAATQNSESAMPEQHEAGVTLSGGWRKPEDGTIASGDLAVTVPVGGAKLIASVHDTYANAKAVRTFEGTDEAVNEHALSASAGIALALGGVFGRGELSGEGLWGKSGWGGRLAYAEELHDGAWGLSAEYRAPFDETLFAIADHADRSRVVLGASHELGEGLTAQIVGHVTRYGIKDNDNVADTAGASASLRYLTNLGGLWAGATYEFNGDYVLRNVRYQGAAPAPFSPLDMRTFEVHALSGSLSAELLDGLWADAYGGYAVDRYGPDGAFGGGDLRYAFAPGWVLALTGGYTQVSTEQGERGPLTTAGLKLIYNLGEEHSGPHPIPLTYYRNL